MKLPGWMWWPMMILFLVMLLAPVVYVMSRVKPAPVLPGGTEMTPESRIAGLTVYRTRVPGGWLYMTTNTTGGSVSTTFVPE